MATPKKMSGGGPVCKHICACLFFSQLKHLYKCKEMLYIGPLERRFLCLLKFLAEN